jgi:hypothetical protein
MVNNENNTENKLCQEAKFGFKDTIAMIIAVFQVFLPIFAVALVIFTIVILFIGKVWL